MEEKIHFKLRPVRIINYIILIALDIFLYIVLRSYFLLLTLVVMLTMPLVSAAGAVYMCRRLEMELGIGKDRLVSGEEALLELRLKNAAWFPALQSRVSLFLSNTFLENGAEWVVEMPVKMHGVSVLKLPLNFVNLGRFSIECKEFQLQDIMGLVIIKRHIGILKEVYVFPDGNIDALPDITNFMAGAAEVEESKHKGNDSSEVNDIREYVPGDRLRDIHWKISARQDKLMVKERIAAAGSEMALVLDLGKDDELARQVLELGFRFAKSFMRGRLPVCILCWNQAGFCFEEYRCSSEEELVSAYSEIYRTSLSGHLNGEWARFLGNSFPYLKAYLWVGVHDGAAGAWMRENN